MISAISNSLGSLVLFADTVRTKFSWDRIEKNTDWILPVVVLVIAAFFVRKWYERDARELGRGIGWFLTIMRTLVFVGLFLIYLKPGWRTETERRIESRVAVLVDTSLSMGLTDSTDGIPNTGPTRAAKIEKLFAKSDLVNELRQTHNVDVYAFGDTLKTVTTLEKFPEEGDQTKQTDNENQEETENGSEESKKPIDWKTVLKPVAGETRLGDSMNQLLDEIRDKPMAGILIATDGGYNTGADPANSVEAANESKIKLFPIGVGSDVLPPNVRVSQLVVPPRVQLGDKYTVLGYIQSRKMKDKHKTVEVQLLLKNEDTGEEPEIVGKKVVLLGGNDEGTGDDEKTKDGKKEKNGKKIPVKFEMMPSVVGHWTYTLRVVAPTEDSYPADDAVEVQFETVDRPLRVLLFAGGPMREYQFMRNLLHRDKGIEVDVFLQSARAKIYQDAHKVLYAFPETDKELSNYDCIIAFDPDWLKLNTNQIEILERWVSKSSGGLILFAGPVNAGETLKGWVQDPRTKTIRDIYPVAFQKSYLTGAGRKGNIDSLTPTFSREGKEADFLSLADNPSKSRKLWDKFDGFYAYMPVEGKKSGATVYARYPVGSTTPDQNSNIYFAGQFYGSGRVFYAGSAELWRLRSLGEEYHERIVTKLVRHVTQGRLLNDSPRGSLSIEREQYVPGDVIEVTARLRDAKIKPLNENKVRMEVTLPGGTKENVDLIADENKPGKFVCRLPVTMEGNYKITAVMPDDESIRIERRFQVKMPDLEREDPVRNDELLGYLADATGGKYYLNTDVETDDGLNSLIARLPNQTKTIVLTSMPNTDWEREWLLWMMILLVGLLAIEWTIRRLLKLA